jgi:lipoprotein-anchoring transpeptidase ErfK/SrfK
LPGTRAHNAWYTDAEGIGRSSSKGVGFDSRYHSGNHPGALSQRMFRKWWPSVSVSIPLILSGFLLGACVQTPRDTWADAALPPRDRAVLANAPYRPVTLPVEYQRTLIEFDRKEAPGSIVIDTDARYLYYVLAGGKALRYGVAVGEEALSWYGIARVGRKQEWPSWTPTPEIRRRLAHVPDFMEGGPQNPMGARALYLYQGKKDTLFRIHGTNQPENIGRAASSGCIRMTNEDVIELYDRVKVGTIVVVLEPKHTNSPAARRPRARLQVASSPAREDSGAARR